MVAVPSTNPGRVFGTAILQCEQGGTLDATFSGLASMGGGAFHIAVIVFDDLQVDGKGIFKHGEPGNQIHGGFFGPDHVEAAGTFESMNLLGAFGAKKQ